MDYTKMKEKRVKKNKSGAIVENFSPSGTTNDLSVAWWKAPNKDAHKYVTTVTNGILNNQQYRAAMNLRYARLYANQEVMGFGINNYYQIQNNSSYSNRVSYNVVKSCIDTAASKIAKMRPRILALTTDGDWDLQQRAKNLTCYLDGAYSEMDIYNIAPNIFLDAGVFGSGFLKIYNDGNKVKCERVFPTELLVDEAEGIYGTPQQLHQLKYIARDVLLTIYGKDETCRQAIVAAQPASRMALGSNTTADFLTVRESWHLKSTADANDGRHMLSIDGATLMSEPYDKNYFPFVKLDWSKRLLGYYGTGIAEELLGIQIEINKLLKNIQIAQHLACVPRVYVENGSQVNPGNFNNQIGSFVFYTGTMPQIVSGQGMSQEVYLHLETLYRRAFEIVGVSQLSSGAKKPSGLNSSVALREMQDIETERFALVAQAYEEFFIKTAEIVIDMTRDMYKNGTAQSVKLKTSKFVETIDWKDVDMERDVYALRLYPVNILPTKPEGRLQKIQELIEAGFLSKEESFSLLDFPDLEAVATMKNSPYDTVMMLIYHMINKGEYVPPEPFMNLTLSRTMVQYAYLKAKLTNVSEERLELLRRFMEDCLTLEQLSMQGVMEPNNAQPLAVPGAPPVSDLLPLNTALPQA